VEEIEENANKATKTEFRKEKKKKAFATRKKKR
jgi:hypothetical protein